MPCPQTWKRCRLLRVRAGEALLTPAAARRQFLVLVEGRACYVAGPAAAVEQGPLLVSCQMVSSSDSKAEVACELAEAAAAACARTPGMAMGYKHSGDCFEKGLLGVLG